MDIIGYSENFVALDVETAQGKRWSICQIGLAIVENGKIQQTITQLIQPPENKYLPGNIRVHGITPEHTANKPLFPEIWEKILPIIDGKLLVAHNAEFDQNCLEQTLEYYNLPVPIFDFHCTLMMSHGQKLKHACECYGVNLDKHHDAGCDAEACAKLYLKIDKGAEPDFSKVTPDQQGSASWFEGHEQLRGDVLKPDLENADPNSPFYGKKVVFTGVLNTIDRKQAAEIVKKMGADIDTSISKKTHFVITGTAPGPSKMAKIDKYNEQGCNIQLLFEDDFLKMIDN